MSNAILKKIAVEITNKLRQSTTVDWRKRWRMGGVGGRASATLSQ